jgi:hypothetical protein
MDTKKYPRTLHFPFSPGTHSDDRIASGAGGLVGAQIVITEKLDGENTCLSRHGVFARSHVLPTRNPWASYLKPFWECTRRDLGELEVFGESVYAVHSIEYTGLEHHFFVFAVRDGNRWLAWDDVAAYAGVLGLPTVPVLFRGVVPDEAGLRSLVEDLARQPSALSDAELGPSEREGVVARVGSSFDGDAFQDCVLKWVRRGHVRTNTFWARNWRRAPLGRELRAMRGLPVRQGDPDDA